MSNSSERKQLRRIVQFCIAYEDALDQRRALPDAAPLLAKLDPVQQQGLRSRLDELRETHARQNSVAAATSGAAVTSPATRCTATQSPYSSATVPRTTKSFICSDAAAKVSFTRLAIFDSSES